jgi:endogenous inhibitor of DNA gyrase (YacG/DUF329 family)
MNCPICKKSVPEDDAHRPPTFPFCSERCKLIDLGRWLDGKYQIPVADKDQSAGPLDHPSDN